MDVKNVRVDVTEPIYDGMEVVFRAPCDAKFVTGLNVYYPLDGALECQNFTFADANATDVGHIDALFGKDAVVKAILDTDTGMAFVQNADTNAYLEGRFAKLEAMIGTGGGTSVIFGDGAPKEDTAGEKGTFYYDIYMGELYLCHDHGAYGENYWRKISVDEDEIVQKVLAALPSAEEVGF